MCLEKQRKMKKDKEILQVFFFLLEPRTVLVQKLPKFWLLQEHCLKPQLPGPKGLDSDTWSQAQAEAETSMKLGFPILD